MIKYVHKKDKDLHVVGILKECLISMRNFSGKLEINRLEWEYVRN